VTTPHPKTLDAEMVEAMYELGIISR